jgi:hypothetical protein
MFAILYRWSRAYTVWYVCQRQSRQGGEMNKRKDQRKSKVSLHNITGFGSEYAQDKEQATRLQYDR